MPFVLPDNEVQCRLRRALLTKEDMPGGFRENPFVGHIYGGQQVDCRVQIPAPTAGLMYQLFPEKSNDNLTGVSQWVYALQPGDAAGLIKALKLQCASLADGGDPKGSIHVIDMPSFGDESFAVQGIVPAVGTIYIRRGDLVTVLLVGTKGDLVAALSQLAPKADAKLANVGPLPPPTPAP